MILPFVVDAMEKEPAVGVVWEFSEAVSTSIKASYFSTYNPPSHPVHYPTRDLLISHGRF